MADATTSTTPGTGGYGIGLQRAGLTLGQLGLGSMLGSAGSSLLSTAGGALSAGGALTAGLSGDQQAYLGQVEEIQRQNNAFQLMLMQRSNQAAQAKQLVDQYTEESKAAMQTSNTLIATQVEQGNAIKGRTEKVQL